MRDALLAVIQQVSPGTPGERWFTLISVQIIGLIATVGSVVVALVAARAANGAKKAVNESPTSNGYAKRTEDQLGELVMLARSTAGKIDDHLAAHAEADVLGRRKAHRDS